MLAKKPMTKTQIVAHLAQAVGVDKKQANAFLVELANLTYAEAKKVGFTIPGIGKMVVVQRKARKGRNPATGEAIKIPAKKVLRFRIAKAAKDNITPTKATS